MSTDRGRAQGPAEPGGIRSLVLAVAGMVLATSLLPWGVVGLLLEVAAVVLGVRALRRARRRDGRAPGALAGVIAGLMGAMFFVVALSFVAIFYAEYKDFRHCVDRALIASERDRCSRTFEDAVRHRIGLTR